MEKDYLGKITIPRQIAERERLWIPETIPVLGFEHSLLPSKSTHIFEVSIGQFSGYFTTELIDGKSQEVLETKHFRNVLTTQFMDMIGAGNAGGGGTGPTRLFHALQVGQGNTPPSASDTVLVSPLPILSTDNGGFSDSTIFVSGSGASGSYFSFKRVRLFTETQSTGTITELGWWSKTSGSVDNKLVCRALVRDTTGATGSIVKTSDQQLRVTYEVRCLVPTSSMTGIMTIGTSSYSWSLYPNNINTGSDAFINIFNTLDWNSVQNYAFATGTIPQPWQPTASITLNISTVTSASAADTSSVFPYTSGNFYRDVSGTWAPSNNWKGFINNGVSGARFVGISIESQTAQTVPQFLWNFDPPIIKTDLQRFNWVVRFTWSQSGTKDF